MKNLLVTGGCGFIGSGFIRHLFDEAGFQGRVINLDSLTYAANPRNLDDIARQAGDRYVFQRADIREPAELVRVFDEYEVDAVCHFAAESHVDRSIVRPDDFVQTNIVGTYHLLEAARARRNRLLRFHHVSTDEVYGSLGKTGRFSERTPYQPNSPYSASKAASDHLARAYRETFGLPVTVSNCSNNYGPFQFPEKLVPLTILHALEGRAIPVYGDGQNIRDWLYVRDHCEALAAVLFRGREGETFNIGGDCEKRNLEIVERLCDLVDEMAEPLSGGRPRRSLVTFVKDRPGHDRRYAIDASKIQSELGWRPRETFDTGLRKTVRWYLDHPDWVGQVRSGEYRTWIRERSGDPAPS